VPDPAGLATVDLTNPQTWNRYAYVGNSPLSSIDLLGLENYDYLYCAGTWCRGNPAGKCEWARVESRRRSCT
jgi:hypothetical protein